LKRELFFSRYVTTSSNRNRIKDEFCTDGSPEIGADQ
jgi:hypothetical protein